MSADKDIVIQNFGEASESHFLLFSVLQLFLSLENGETRSPYDIAANDVYALCAQKEGLPQKIRDFISWQCNIKQRDNGQILNIEIPHGLCKPYDVMEAKLADVSADEREALIRGCIEEIDDYLGQLQDVCAILEAAEDRFNTVEMLLLYGHGQNAELSQELSVHDKPIEHAREEIDMLHAALEGDIMPDFVSFEPTVVKMHNLIRRLSDIHLSIRDTVRRYNLGQGDET